MTSAAKKSGRIKRNNGTPADLIATSSKLSPRFPKVIMEDSNTANGSASGTSVADTYMMNLPIVKKSMPFPTMSSM